MKCNRCGKENSPQARGCRYCGNYPLVPLNRQPARSYQQQNRNIHQNKSNASKNQGLLISIISLCVVFVLVIGIAAFNEFGFGKRGGFGGAGSGGGGGMGGSISGSTPSQIPNATPEAPVTLDGEDPDVEIYSFAADVYDILVGETETVTFTAEIFANVVLEENDVVIQSASGETLGYMKDNGTDGDAIAGDGTYTFKTELHSNNRKEEVYCVKSKNVYSNSIKVFYYTQISSDQLRQCERVINRVSELNDLEAIKNYLISESMIEHYEASADGIVYILKPGVTCIWNAQPMDEGVKGSASNGSQLFANYTGIRQQVSNQNLTAVHSKKDVCVIRPFRSTQFLYDDFLDAGNIIAEATEGTVDLYDDGNATINVFKNLDDYGVVLIDSHGELSNFTNSAWDILNDDPYILTGQKYTTWEMFSSADWQAQRIIVSGGINFGTEGIVAVGAGFFDRYYEDNSLDDAVFFLGTCYSLYNDTIADVLIEKGASVVYGFSNVVSTGYCNDVLKASMIDQMIVNCATAQEGFNYAVQQFGAIDPHGNSMYNCHFEMRGQNNFKLVEQKKIGKVSGSVRDALTNQPISGAMVRIYRDGVLIKITQTDASGLYTAELLVGEYVIKVDCGQYKTGKSGVTVLENTTVYVETLLMIDVGVNSGFANGMITDAVSGEAVSGVSIRMRRSWDNRDGEVLHTMQTNENGYYEVSYAPGFYTIEYSKEGYITGYKNIIIGIVDFAAQNAAISPEMPEDGNFRIVLSWSNLPMDLDSHLTGPTVDGNRFHLFYRYADTTNRNENMDYYRLDLDNTNIVSKPNIPETTTIVTQLDGVYRYSVHDFSNRGRANSEAMSQSNATVNVYKGSVLVATFHVPPNVTGTIWTVFELSGDTITPINRIGNGYEHEIDKF